MNKCHLFVSLTELQKRLLNSHKYRDYVYLFLIGFIPIIFSALIGVHKSVNIQNIVRAKGYWDYYNWTFYPLILPISLYLLRWMADIFFSLSSRSYERENLLSFFENREPEVKNRIQDKLIEISIDVKNIAIALCLDIFFHIADIRETITLYVLYYQNQNYIPTTNNLGWSSFFLLPNLLQKQFLQTGGIKFVDAQLNLLLVFLAYLNQFIIILIGFIAIILVFRHNLFYLQRIYQRSRVPERQIKYHIILDFDDPNRRWGLTRLNLIFNIQVVFLVVAGLFLLLSRYANVSNQYYSLGLLIDLSNEPGGIIKNLYKILEKISLNKLFPDVGQVVIAIGWIIAFAVVSLPSCTKFIPFISLNVLRQGMTITDYLREFITPQQENRNYPLDTDQNVNSVAQKFARNSFWPAGDDIARSLFYFAFFVFFVLLIPLDLNINKIENIANICLVFMLSISVTFGTLWLLKFVLSHVDSRLVKLGE